MMMVKRNRWKILIGIALAFGTQEAFTGEAWLVITSDPPGATIDVDNTYRGVTPQRPSDALPIQVPQGTHEIKASVRIDGKDYVAREVVEVRGDRETFVQLNLRKESPRASITPTAPPIRGSKSLFGKAISLDKLEVPGRNF